MNTHIIIPIKEWKAQREFYRSKLKEIDKAQIAPSHDYYRLQGICANMDSILAHEKQISLDEKDKDFYKSRAKKSLNENFFDTIQGGEIHCYIQGYKQALLDLL